MGFNISDLPTTHPLRQKVEQATGEDFSLQAQKQGKRGEPEHELQVAAVEIFRLAFPKYKKRLFAIPNGGARNAVVGGKLKAEGVLAGVWDLFLAVPCGPYGGCYIETKIGDNDLSTSQQKFRASMGEDYHFFVYRTVHEFCAGVQDYFNMNQTGGEHGKKENHQKKG